MPLNADDEIVNQHVIIAQNLCQSHAKKPGICRARPILEQIGCYLEVTRHLVVWTCERSLLRVGPVQQPDALPPLHPRW